MSQNASLARSSSISGELSTFISVVFVSKCCLRDRFALLQFYKNVTPNFCFLTSFAPGGWSSKPGISLSEPSLSSKVLSLSCIRNAFHRWTIKVAQLSPSWVLRPSTVSSLAWLSSEFSRSVQHLHQWLSDTAVFAQILVILYFTSGEKSCFQLQLFVASSPFLTSPASSCGLATTSKVKFYLLLQDKPCWRSHLKPHHRNITRHSYSR